MGIGQLLAQTFPRASLPFDYFLHFLLVLFGFSAFMHIFAKENQNEIVNKLINHKKMQNTDTERLVAIRKAYADYSKLMYDIDTLDNAMDLYKRTLGGLMPGYYNVLETILKQRSALASIIINKVKEYFEKYSTLETLEKYLDGLIGPFAYIYALESLTGENFM